MINHIPYVNPNLLDYKTNLKIKVFSKSSVILPSFLDQTFFVYNGKTFIKLQILSSMIGYKFGEFVFSKVKAVYKSKKLKKKKKK